MNTKFRHWTFLFTAAVLAAPGCSDHADPVYKDASQSVERRVEDLLSRMTLEEKVGQMCQYVGLNHMRQTAVVLSEAEMKKSHAMGFYADCPPERIEEMIREGITGSFLHVTSVEEANYIQSLALRSRLAIPVLIGIDAMHGTGLVRGATVYPTEIGQAAAFNPELVERIGRETALEMRASGSQWTFGPNIEVARDARWGRVGDTFGEDPYLVSQLGVATVKGLQGRDFTGEDYVIACAKHMAGGSQPVNGINGAPNDMSERTLREVFLPPFEKCVEAGIYTVMAAHNEYDGIPCHGSRFLLTDILRDEWDFGGFVVSDWMDIERMQDYHTTGETLRDVYAQTLDAGMDMHMHGPDFYYEVLKMVREGVVPESRIDASVRPILAAKFRLGLFENPYVDEETTRSTLFCEEHRATALEAARQSVVLLENDGILPLDPAKYRRVLVTGPFADNQVQLGDWAFEQPDENVTTVWEGLQAVSPGTQFTLCDLGWNIRKITPEQVRNAVRQAAGKDLAIVVAGENSLRYYWTEKTCGENSDRYDISLYGEQEPLIRALHATGIPVVVVLTNGRPLSTEWISANVAALVEAWEPGSLGGQAVAEVLYGRVNPSGRMPISVPRHSGQIPVYYNHKFTHHWFRYATGDSSPLYEFGYGLSYTTFEYGDVELSSATMAPDGQLTASVSLTNTGGVAGTEVVQLYLRDKVSSATRPVKELKDFRRVTLAPGESARVEFTLTPDKLAYYDAKMHYGVEPGDFEVMIGSSSRDKDLRRAVFTVK